MNDKEILKEAINKAIFNEYRLEPRNRGDVFRVQKDLSVKVFTESSICLHHKSLFEIIFSHDFAKAFFGNKKHTFKSMGNYVPLKMLTVKQGWEYHLQQMVLCEDRLKYLEKFLDEEA